MGSIYRIRPKNSITTNGETYIGFNSHEDPLYRVKEHMECAYGLSEKSSGQGSTIIGKYGASGIEVDVWDDKTMYGISQTSYLAFQKIWNFKNYKDAKLEFAEICWILYYDELGIGQNIGIGDQGGMSFTINVLPNTDFIKDELEKVMNSFGVSMKDMDANKVWRPENFGTVTFHLGDTVDMKMKLFAPETYIYSRALCYLMTAYTFFRQKPFLDMLRDCAKAQLEQKDCKPILDNYVNKCRHECILIWNRNPVLSSLAKAGAIYTHFTLDEALQKIFEYISDWAVKTTIQQWYQEGKKVGDTEVYDIIGYDINKLKHSDWKKQERTQEFNKVMKFNRKVYVYASVSNVPVPQWYQYAKMSIERHLKHEPTYDKATEHAGKPISYRSFKEAVQEEVTHCPIKDNSESWFWILDDPLGTVFSNSFRRSDKSLRAVTLRKRMKQRMQTKGKIQPTASFIRKWDIYYRQCMSLWLPPSRHLKKTSDAETKFSIGAEDRYSLTYVSVLNQYGYKYWFKSSTWNIIDFSYKNDLKVGAFLYW